MDLRVTRWQPNLGESSDGIVRRVNPSVLAFDPMEIMGDHGIG